MKAERVQDRLRLIPEWDAETDKASDSRGSRSAKKAKVKVKAIRRVFVFSCFIEAMAFVDRVADIAWEMKLSPGIYVCDDRVSIRIPGGSAELTDAHFDLAQAIDDLVA